MYQNVRLIQIPLGLNLKIITATKSCIAFSHYKTKYSILFLAIWSLWSDLIKDLEKLRDIERILSWISTLSLDECCKVLFIDANADRSNACMYACIQRSFENSNPKGSGRKNRDIEEFQVRVWRMTHAGVKKLGSSQNTCQHQHLLNLFFLYQIQNSFANSVVLNRSLLFFFSTIRNLFISTRHREQNFETYRV